MNEIQAQKIIELLTDISKKLDAQTHELESIKNLFLKYDVELLLNQEEFRDE